jgi:cyclophilin family peptidyl-prolyl cis-trans isomerase
MQAFSVAAAPLQRRARSQAASALRASAGGPPPRPRRVTRRAALALAAGALTAGAAARAADSVGSTAAAPADSPRVRSPADATVTNKVFFNVKVGATAAPRIVIGLFGEDAPVSVASFMKVCTGTLRGRGGRTASYAYSQAWRVVKDERIDLGRVKQIDEVNQSPGTAQRQIVLVEVPENRDVNDIAHVVAGAVSVRRGGGAFEFTITPAPAAGGGQLDQENIVIGRVLEGMDAIQAMNSVPTNQKTVRDGFRKVGRVIGDGRAKLDVRSRAGRQFFAQCHTLRSTYRLLALLSHICNPPHCSPASWSTSRCKRLSSRRAGLCREAWGCVCRASCPSLAGGRGPALPEKSTWVSC